MVIYNVTIKVKPEVADQWLGWMKEEHLSQMLATGLFVNHRMARLLDQEEDEGITFVVQYECKSLDDYEAYLSNFADEMRQKGLTKFGDQFIAFRTLMEIIE